MRTQTLTQPTTHHAQPGHKTSPVRAPETQKQQQAHACTHARTHTHTTPDQVQVEKKEEEKKEKQSTPSVMSFFDIYFCFAK